MADGPTAAPGYNRRQMVDLIPRDVLFGNPERLAPAVSPDGRRIALHRPGRRHPERVGGHARRRRPEPVSNDRERGVRSFAWCADNRHIVYPQDSGGDENWHLHVVDLEDGGDVDVTPFDGVQARILAADRRQPHHLLIGLNRATPSCTTPTCSTSATARWSFGPRTPASPAGWSTPTLQVRGGMAFLPDGGVEIRVGDPATGDYRTLLAVGSEDAISTDVAGFTHDGDAIYLVTSKDTNAARLLQMDVATGAFEVLAEDPTYDVSDVVIDPDTHRVQVVTFTRERADHVVLDRCVAGRRRGDARAAPRRPALPRPRPRRPHLDRRLHRRRRPGRLLRLRPRDAARPRSCSTTSPTSRSYTLAAMEPFAFTSRDGLDVHGYLTLPARLRPTRAADGAVRPRRPVGARHLGLRHPTPQWLANRGYAVRAGQLPRLDRLRQGLPERRRPRVGRAHARRPARRRRTGPSSRATPTPSGSRSTAAPTAATRRWSAPTFTPDVFRCAVDVVGPSEPAHADPQHPAVLGAAASRSSTGASATPTTGGRLPVVALAALAGRADPHPAADRARARTTRASRRRSPSRSSRR